MNAVEYYTKHQAPRWRITSPYGRRTHPIKGTPGTMHWGTDMIPLVSNRRIPVPSPFKGTVTAARTMGGRGKTVTVRIEGRNEIVLFQHLDSYLVRPGDRIMPGDPVGICGTSGDSTGIHLHLEIRIDDGSAIGSRTWGDPAKYQLQDLGSTQVKTAVLDPGHGGADSGGTADGVREKTLTLFVAKATRAYLDQRYEGHRVVLTREKDIAMRLADRAEVGRRENADLFASIHFNWFRDPAANGFETFTNSGPLFKVTLNYQAAIHETIYSYMKTLGVRDRRQKRADHIITRLPPCPTVLIEYLFLSNPAELAHTKSEQKLLRMAAATGEGIARALNLPKKQVAPPPQPEPEPTPPSGPLPTIQRPMPIRIEGKPTAVEAYLLTSPRYPNGRTFVEVTPTVEALDGKVTPGGDHINISK